MVKNSWKYPNWYKWKYSALSNYSGYKLLHYSDKDTLLVLGAVHNTMVIAWVLAKKLGMFSCEILCLYFYRREISLRVIVDTKHIDEKSLRYFPRGVRDYRINWWDFIGYASDTPKNKDIHPWDINMPETSKNGKLSNIIILGGVLKQNKNVKVIAIARVRVISRIFSRNSL